jgi:hypothetical protein
VLVPFPVQHEIAQKAPLVAYVPSRLAPGWHYVRWTHTGGALRIWFRNHSNWEITFTAAPFRGNCPAGRMKTFFQAGVKTYWSQSADEQDAWRCVNGMKLVAATSLPSDRFADVGLGRLVASGHRVH